MAPILTEGPGGAWGKAPQRQEQASDVLISFPGNSLTLFHPEPMSVLIQVASGQHVPQRDWPLTGVSLPHSAPEVPVLPLGGTLCSPLCLGPSQSWSGVKVG